MSLLLVGFEVVLLGAEGQELEAAQPGVDLVKNSGAEHLPGREAWVAVYGVHEVVFGWVSVEVGDGNERSSECKNHGAVVPVTPDGSLSSSEDAVKHVS